MSVTFTCEDAPTAQVPCPYCASTPSDRLVNGRCDKLCRGTMRQSEAPEVNFSNGNAFGLLGVIELPVREYGKVAADDVPAVLRRVLRALNVDARRTPLDEAPRDERGEGGCRIVSFGTSDADTIRRLTALQALLVYAADHHFSVSWG